MAHTDFPAAFAPAEHSILAGGALKRATDVVLAATLLAILAPLLTLAALAVTADGGPALYRQTRVGRFGARFACLKLRTMRPDADRRLAETLAADPAARAEWARRQKLARDPRVTAIGRLLRRTRLDEAPQLVNVLRGEMSLVGPRPIVPPEIPGYDGDRAYYESPHFRTYARFRPGVTGLWQVSVGARDDYGVRIAHDALYARRRGFWADLAILGRTALVVARCGGH